LILTFNLGRDITLLVLYPYVFGWMLFMGWMWWEARVRSAQAPSHRRQRGIRKRVSDSDSNPSGWTQTKSNDDE